MKNQPHLFWRWLLPVAILSFCFKAQGQNLSDSTSAPPKLSAILMDGSTRQWHSFVSGVTINPQSPATFFEQYPAFGLQQGYGMTLLSQIDDIEHKISHYKFQQTYQGIPIAGAEYILHQRQTDEGPQPTGNGRIVAGFEKKATPSISGDAALQTALGQVRAVQYAWQSPKYEAQLKTQRKDPNATTYPKPQLVYRSIADNPDDPSDYRLAYTFDVMALDPPVHQKFYVDAETGKVLESLNLIHSCRAEDSAYDSLPQPGRSLEDTPQNLVSASGTTLYNGPQTITTTQLPFGLYALRTPKIITVDATTENIYINTTTNWNTIPAAVQGHWGVEKTIDYYWRNHGRDAFDGRGTAVTLYMNERESGINNAFWSGGTITIGKGDGIHFNPFGALDVMGHEYTHGVVATTCNLEYNHNIESASLNESFADIFGTMVEYTYGGASSNWTFMEQVAVDGRPNRSLINPKVCGHPDTYHGTNWAFSIDDDAHTNAGVQNRWFYLLSQGGSGYNDNGDYYFLRGIGRDKAAAITFSNLRDWLVSTSGYEDARFGSMFAAITLFGIGSIEQQEVMNAWHAVGVGTRYEPYTPPHLTATPGNGLVVLNWARPNTPYSFYRLYGGPQGTVPELIANIPFGTTTFTHKCLFNNATYRYQIAAVDESLIESKSEEVNATLVNNPTSTPPVPVNLSATAVGVNSFQASWCRSWGATGYQLDVSTNSAFSGTLILNNVAVSDTRYTVEHLNANTVYYFRVRSVNANGASTNSDHFTLRTLPAPPPPPAPVGLSASVDVDNFFAAWTPIFQADSYRVDVSTTEDFSAGNIYTDITVTQPFYLASGLRPNKGYYWRVRAVSAGGTSANSVRHFTITAPGRCGTLELPVLTVQPADEQSVFVSWADVLADTYVLSYKLSSASSYTVAGTGFFSGMQVAGLVPGSTYNFKVKASRYCENWSLDPNFEEATSNVVTVTLPVPACAAPQPPVLTVLPLPQGAITNWTNVDANFYTLYYKRQSESQYTASCTSTTLGCLLLNTLPPDTYMFKVIAHRSCENADGTVTVKTSTSNIATHTISSGLQASLSEGNASMLIYPNPVEGDVIMLNTQNETAGTYEVTIINSYGEPQQKQQVYLESKSVVIEIDVRDLPPSIYLLRFTSLAGKVKTFRFERK